MINAFGITMIFGLVLLFGLASLVLFLWALIDCITSDRPAADKILWVIVILLFNLIGAILYFILADKTHIDPKKKLKKSGDKVVFGVCGGIAEYLGIDKTLVRLLWVIFTLITSGTGLVVYIVAALIMPESGRQREKNDGSAVKILLWAGGLLFLVMVVMSLFVTFAFMSSQGTHVTRSIKVESVVEERIENSYNFREYAGHDLTLVNVDEPEGECVAYDKDPYGLVLYHPECQEYSYQFRSDERGIEGFEVSALVVGDDIKSMRFVQVKMPDVLPASCDELKMNETYLKLKEDINKTVQEYRSKIEEYRSKAASTDNVTKLVEFKQTSGIGELLDEIEIKERELAMLTHEICRSSQDLS